jgi:nitrite reductase/ring-hydroxylating ferredoxin subunit
MRLQKVVVIAGILSALLVLSACAPSSGGPSQVSADPISGTWIDAAVSGDTVTVPLAVVEEHVNTHFSVETGGRKLDFMAYLLDGEVQIRANACPPCRSRGFALDGDVLVCDACQTTFDARDGSGIAGACVDYPKASVEYRIEDGAITMALSDLVEAYDETLIAG